MFFKADSCRLLDNPAGPAAQRFAHYDDFLNHNHQALRHLAELEMLDRGDGLATLASIQRRAADLLEEVSGLVEAIRGLAGDRYPELPEVFKRVAGDLAPLMKRERNPIQGPLVLPFPMLESGHLPLAGAKAVNLALIRNRLGFPAPDGFVVTTAAFDLFLRENRLLEAIDDMLAVFDPDADDIEEECRRIRERILEAPLPEVLTEALHGAYRELADRHGGLPELAMRSSAVGEDTEASFAGQYTSVLPVNREEIDSAYKTVLAGKYTPRAIVYRLRYGLTDAATPMAVAAVIMIRPRASGVLYTLDPARPIAGQARIDAASGLGEQVVGGTVSPDVFLVDRNPPAIRRRSIPPGGQAPEAEESTPAISDSTALALTAAGLKMEDHFGSPQDIEWAEDMQGELVFLQARPLGITAAAGKAGAPDTSGLTLLLSTGQTASPGGVSGVAVHARAGLKAEALEKAILVSRTASPDLAPLMGRVRGLITDLGGVASHLASVAREHHVPALMDTRTATMEIPDGREITLLADEGKVYAGLVPDLERKLPDRDTDENPGTIGRHLRDILDRISPLNLTDPDAPEFTPKGCRTLHDLIRFAHEMVMVEMFNLSRLADKSVVSQKMNANIPLSLYFIDLGGGLAPGLTTCDEILPEHIRSGPMTALWRGFTHPGVTWSGDVGISAGNFMALMAGSIGPGGMAPRSVDSYALVSRDYLNLSVKFGYHYANLEALCSDDLNANTLTLQFSGGAGTGTGKALRIEFLSEVLTRLGYTVEIHGDMLQAGLKGLDCPAMEDVLDQTGRLLGCSRLLDLAIPNQAEVQTLTELFFQGDYDFLGRSEARLPGFYASVGEWSITELDGEEVIFQDGSSMGGTVSCALHNTLETVLGGRYRKFLENRHALHYYPVSVKRGGRHGDGRILADARITAGCVDLAAGLAFGIWNVGNCLVLAADAAAGELQLLEFINNVRHFRERIPTDIPLDQWLQLEVSVKANEITGRLGGRALLRFTAPKAVSGYMGLWSKGDTTACFRNLNSIDAQDEEQER
ncbi:PEP/pyruvate-binding domain-containing protein [Desulfococcus sp.]|uniref:PEP/pyruvate-binding domain-containing protein n=1 Tax=Desulfococcus sp. TaxID=2025834 RepID=UPI0035943416